MKYDTFLGLGMLFFAFMAGWNFGQVGIHNEYINHYSKERYELDRCLAFAYGYASGYLREGTKEGNDMFCKEIIKK